MNVSKHYRLLFLVLVVLAIYFPAITTTINTVDDVHILKAYGNGQLTLQQILLPGNQFYFRPIIELTYYLDNFIWGLEPSFMHLENILLHALNVILVYLFASRIAELNGEPAGLPFVGALLFAVHPINTEPVSWIAGRTDPLAAFFILLSFIYLLKSHQSGKVTDFIFSVAAMFCSFLVKETAFMLLPASILLAYSLKLNPDALHEGHTRVRRWINVTYPALLALGAVFAVVRLFLKPSGSENAFTMLQSQDFDSVELAYELLTTLGFYVKKLFIPSPLNFAIDNINPWYVVPGILAVVALILFFRARRIYLILFITTLLFIFPALIVKLTAINWTPVAERYLYIPSTFFSILAAAGIIRMTSGAWQKRALYPVLTIIIIFFGVTAFKRNIVWRDNFTLYSDAVSKSPNFGDIHNELGVALGKRGEFESARKHFFLAKQLSRRPLIRTFAELNLLNCDMQGKSLYEKKDIISRYVALNDNVQPEVLRMLRNVYHNILFTGTDPKENESLRKKIIALNDRLYRETNDTHCLYSNGQLMLALGNQRAALDYFRKTVIAAPSDAYYYEPAKKLIYRLENR